MRVGGVWKYLYRAVDSAGSTLDFLLTARRDGKAAKRFLRKVLQREHIQTPRVINTDKNGCYVKAIAELKQSGELPESCEHRPTKCLNNIVEQDHRFVRWRVKASQHFKSFWSAQRTLRGYETINMLRKGQLEGIARGDVVAQNNFVDQLFGIAV
ncbi:MAG: IS6 family transposase [Synechococcus sp.]